MYVKQREQHLQIVCTVTVVAVIICPFFLTISALSSLSSLRQTNASGEQKKSHAQNNEKKNPVFQKILLHILSHLTFKS